MKWLINKIILKIDDQQRLGENTSEFFLAREPKEWYKFISEDLKNYEDEIQNLKLVILIVKHEPMKLEFIYSRWSSDFNQFRNKWLKIFISETIFSRQLICTLENNRIFKIKTTFYMVPSNILRACSLKFFAPMNCW